MVRIENLLKLLEVGSGRKNFTLEKDVFLMDSGIGQICAWPLCGFLGLR